MQAKISAGNNCLRISQVTGEIYLRPQVICVKRLLFVSRRIFSNLETFLFILLSSTKHFKHSDRSKHLLPLKSMVNPSNLIMFQKNWTIHCWLFKPLSTKIHFNEKFFTIAKMIGNWLMSLFDFYDNSRVKD